MRLIKHLPLNKRCWDGELNKPFHPSLKNHWINTKEISMEPKLSPKWGSGRSWLSASTECQPTSERWKMAGSLLATEPAGKARSKDRERGKTLSSQDHAQKVLCWEHTDPGGGGQGGAGTAVMNHQPLSYSEPVPPPPDPSLPTERLPTGSPWPPIPHRWSFSLVSSSRACIYCWTCHAILGYLSVSRPRTPGVQVPGLCHLTKPIICFVEEKWFFLICFHCSP